MIVWFDVFVHRLNGSREVSTQALYNDYRSHCLLHNINAPPSVRGFHMIFRDLLVNECSKGIERFRSSKIRGFKLNQNECFEWLQEKEYTMYESLDQNDDDESTF